MLHICVTRFNMIENLNKAHRVTSSAISMQKASLINAVVNFYHSQVSLSIRRQRSVQAIVSIHKL